MRARPRPAPLTRAWSGEAGYTLVEILAAMFIIGLAAGLVVLSLPPPGDRVELEALAFAERLRVAADEAVVTGRTVGADIDASGYRFRERRAGEWSPVSDHRALRPREWPQAAAVEAARLGGVSDRGRLADLQTQPAAPPLVSFDPTGAATPAQIRISLDAADYVVSVDAAGAVSFTQTRHD